MTKEEEDLDSYLIEFDLGNVKRHQVRRKIFEYTQKAVLEGKIEEARKIRKYFSGGSEMYDERIEALKKELEELKG